MFNRDLVVFAATALLVATSYIAPASAGVPPPVDPPPPPPPPAVLDVTLTEGLTIDGNEFSINYTISHNGPEDGRSIIAFAVDFGIPPGFDEDDSPIFFGPNGETVHEDWDAQIVTAETWDNGVQFSFLGLDTEEFGAFDSIFSAGAEVAALFSLEIDPDDGQGEGPPLLSFEDESFLGTIDPFQTAGGFSVTGFEVSPRSNFIAICADGNLCASGSAIGVPEPGALALLGVGLVGFAFLRRRRKL